MPRLVILIAVTLLLSGCDRLNPQYTVTIHALGDGHVSAERLVVRKKDEVTIDILPHAHTRVDNILAIGCQGQLEGSIYTIYGFTKDCYITVRFASHE